MLDRNPVQLQSLIGDFDTTANAFAREDKALGRAVGELPRTLRAAVPALDALDAALPPPARPSARRPRRSTRSCRSRGRRAASSPGGSCAG